MKVATQPVIVIGFEARHVGFQSPVCATRSCFNQIPDAIMHVTTICAEKVLYLPEFAKASKVTFCELSGSRSGRSRRDHHQFSGIEKQREERAGEREGDTG